VRCFHWGAQQYIPKQSDRPEPGTGDEPFKPIFDGKTLDGWEGDPKYWRIDGALVGEVTPETLLQSNSFIIWRGGAQLPQT
jgi:hypothetical protein